MASVRNVEHRPWPLPLRPWLMTQTWHNLLFAHWPCPPEMLQSLLPSGLTLDSLRGQAWIGIVAFKMTDIRLRGLPVMPMVASFPEINVRTYVTVNDRPGVYFLSLDADNPVAIALAKPWFRLAYHRAQIAFTLRGGRVEFSSIRRRKSKQEARFSATYRPCSGPQVYGAGTLENWLTERYCFYSANGRGDIYCGEIDHPQWELQKAEAEIATNTMALAHGISLPDTEPLLHYAHRMEALFWRIKKQSQHADSIRRQTFRTNREPAI